MATTSIKLSTDPENPDLKVVKLFLSPDGSLAFETLRVFFPNAIGLMVEEIDELEKNWIG